VTPEGLSPKRGEVLNGIFYILWTGCQWERLRPPCLAGGISGPTSTPFGITQISRSMPKASQRPGLVLDSRRWVTIDALSMRLRVLDTPS
jgi:hypothetical protein